VWEAASRLWADWHRRAAIQAAATAVFDGHLPAKLGRMRDAKGGVDVVGQAFSIKPPEPDAPRLRLRAYDEAAERQDWVNAHEGAMKLGQGCAQFIRNLSTHNLDEPADQEGLEMLANLSLFARLVDAAEVERA
jgi:hypothetical protein